MMDAMRLTRAARRLRWVTLAGILLVVAAMVLGCWALAIGPLRDAGITFDVDAGGLAPVPAAIVLLIAGSLLIAALAQIAAMLRAVERGAPFRTGAALRRFGLFLFLAVLASVLLPPLIQLAESLLDQGSGRVNFSLSGEELLMLFVSGLIFFVARLLEAAQALADEHAQIV